MTTMKRPLSVSVGPELAGRVSDMGLDPLLKRAQDGITGVEQRIAGMDDRSTPAAYLGSQTFQPETQSFALDTWQNGTSSNLVNYVLRSGNTYEIPVLVGGDGIFLAHSVRFVLWQRQVFTNLGVSGNKAAALIPVSPLVYPFGNGFTTKFSVIGGPAIAPAINFRWNVQAPISGVRYSDNWLPGGSCAPRTWTPLGGGGGFQDIPLLFDGDWHEFASPWRFDMAQIIVGQFCPVSDIVQYDSTISGATASPTGPGYGYDDRENGVRNQAVTVQVEFQGERIGGSR